MLKRLLAARLPSAEVESLLQQELCEILAVCNPLRVYLFGSAARGAMTSASDLDLLVEMSDDTDLKGVKKAYYCRRKTHHWPVDIVFMKASDFAQRSKVGGVAMVCLQEGRLVYQGLEKGVIA